MPTRDRAASDNTTALGSPALLPRVVITGASGFLGSHFLLALQKQRPSQVWALVRGADEAAAEHKLQESLRTAAESYHAFQDHAAVAADSRVFLGDISQPGCAVSESVLGACGPIDELWHFAGSLNFEEKQRDFVWAHNIGGARHTVELAIKLGAKRYIYVSTAYTSGKKTGIIPEQLHDPNGAFNNCYEESKCRAEHLITELCREAGIALTIFRPSIVIGPSESKLPGGSRSGVYGFIREMNRLASAIKNWPGAVRLAAEPIIPLNIIPVDYLVRDMMDVVQAGFAGSDIVHLTSSVAPSVEHCVLTVTKGLGLRSVEIAQGSKDGFSPLEQLLDQRIVFYGGYLNGEKTFARSLPTRWQVSPQEFRGFATEGIRERRRTSVTSVFTRREVESFDGAALSTYSCGSGMPGVPILLANAVGMPAAFWTPLATRLATQHPVITWETRGVPSFTSNFSESACDIDAHVRDLLAVMAAYDVNEAHVFGWCTGALVALKIAATAPERVRSLVLLNGSYSLHGDQPRTQFERNMRVVMPKIASSRRTAELYYRTIYLPTRNAESLAHADEVELQITQLLMSTDPDLIHLTSFPYDNVDTLHRYGRLITETLKEEVGTFIQNVHCPAFVVSGEQDVTEHPDASRYIASQLSDATLRIYPEMDHFGLFNSPTLAEDVAAFLLNERAHAAREPELVALGAE